MTSNVNNGSFQSYTMLLAAQHCLDGFTYLLRNHPTPDIANVTPFYSVKGLYAAQGESVVFHGVAHARLERPGGPNSSAR